jgi:hypothetical protein
MRRTWRLRPSRSVSSMKLSGTVLRTRIGGERGHSQSGANSSRRALTGSVGPSLSSTPSRRPRQLLFARFALDLHHVGLGPLELRRADLRDAGAVVGEQQQAFGIGIEAPGRIHLGRQAVAGERGPRRRFAVGELAQHPEGLVEKGSSPHPRLLRCEGRRAKIAAHDTLCAACSVSPAPTDATPCWARCSRCSTRSSTSCRNC